MAAEKFSHFKKFYDLGGRYGLKLFWLQQIFWRWDTECMGKSPDPFYLCASNTPPPPPPPPPSMNAGYFSNYYIIIFNIIIMKTQEECLLHSTNQIASFPCPMA